MKWQLKLLKNSIIGLLPKPIQRKAREIKRSVRSHKLVINKWTLSQGIQQVQLLRNSGFDPSNKDYLELGTGWSPVIPLLFWLAGCKSLTMIDDQRLMDTHTFQETCKQMISECGDISAKLKLETADIKNKLNELADMPLKSALSKMNCNYHAPYDMLDNDIPDHSIDIITSRAVLEHIPPKIVSSILGEFFRLLRKSGAMSHIVDNSDHWEHNDKSISRLNYLKYSQRAFDFISSLNPLDYQNRLRHSEYIKLAKTAGFEIIMDESLPDIEALNDLDIMTIHPDFSSFAKNDLAILTSHLVLGIPE